MNGNAETMTDISDETMVAVDSKEPQSFVLAVLSHPDVDRFNEIDLDAADIVVNGVGFERKTPSDFASSMLDDRLDEQVIKLTQMYDQAAILIEGSFDDFDDLEHTRLKPESARGKAASIHMRDGIPVIPTGGKSGETDGHVYLADYALRLGRKVTEEPSSSYLKSSAVGSDVALGVRMWGCYDGIGSTRAHDLNESVGNPSGLLSWATESEAHEEKFDRYRYIYERLITVSGIGAKTAESIVNQFEHLYDQYHSTEVQSDSEAYQNALNSTVEDS